MKVAGEEKCRKIGRKSEKRGNEKGRYGLMERKGERERGA